MYLKDIGLNRFRSATDITYVVIKSSLLDGEQIVLVMKPTALKSIKEHYPDLVMYYTPEIQELYKHKQDKALIKQAHITKKMFGATITAQTINQRREEHDNRESEQLSIKCIGG